MSKCFIIIEEKNNLIQFLLRTIHPSAYLSVPHDDGLDDKPAIGQPPRHSPLPVDPESGVYTGLKEEKEMSENKEEKPEKKHSPKNMNACENKVKDVNIADTSENTIEEKTGRKEWF